MPAEHRRPLEGMKVVDLGWITAGAGTSAMLADLGADVVKVEGPGAPDPFRQWDGAPPGTEWWNGSPFFAFTNRGKRSLCIDLKRDEGREAMDRLLENADVLVENFRRGVMASLGLAPADLRERYPRLVIAAISSQGETGPDSAMVSYGSTLEATGGLAGLTGTGAVPVITGRDMNYPDQVVCLFACGAVLAALLERRRTGSGTHLDLSQRELTGFLLGEEMVAAAAGGPPTRRGNDDPLSPGEVVERRDDGWCVMTGPDRVLVRDAEALVGSPEFGRGTAVAHTSDGRAAKGLPFRIGGRPAEVGSPCRTLGADNQEVLAELGFLPHEISAMEESGAVATAPTRP